MKNAKKYYTVWKGRKPGVYETWSECKEQTDGFENARFKSFTTKDEAQKAYESDYHEYLDFRPKEEKTKEGEWSKEAIAVDASCTGNPGMTEFRGIDLRTGKEVFTSKQYKKGTNNIGEVLAIVKALEILRRRDDRLTKIYSDSQIAINIVEKKKMKTSLERTEETKEILDDLEKAMQMLKENNYGTKVEKWRTEQWGEIPADFGRK